MKFVNKCFTKMIIIILKQKGPVFHGNLKRNICIPTSTQEKQHKNSIIDKRQVEYSSAVTSVDWRSS